MSERARARLVGIAVTVLWSSSWMLIRWGHTNSVDPLAFAALRYLAASVVLGGGLLVRQRGAAKALFADVAVLRLTVVHGLTYYALTQGAQFVAIVHQPAASTSLLLCATTVVVAGLSWVVLGERVARSTVAGAGLMMVGASIYLQGRLGFTGVGTAAALVALGGNSAATLLGRAVNRQGAHSPLAVTATSMSVGAVALTVAVLVAGRPFPRLDARLLASAAWMALVNTALAFTLWSWALRHLRATEAAVINNLMLVEIGLFGWLAFGETPTALNLIGMATVLVGTLIASQLRTASAKTSWVRRTRPGPRPG